MIWLLLLVDVSSSQAPCADLPLVISEVVFYPSSLVSMEVTQMRPHVEYVNQVDSLLTITVTSMDLTITGSGQVNFPFLLNEPVGIDEYAVLKSNFTPELSGWKNGTANFYLVLTSQDSIVGCFDGAVQIGASALLGLAALLLLQMTVV